MKTAETVGESERTVKRARGYVRSIEKYPNLKKFNNVRMAINEANRRDSIKKREKAALPKLKNLLLGDCLERIDDIKNCSIDVMITDPPFGTGKNWGRGNTMKMRENWDFPNKNVFEMLDTLFEKSKNKLKPDSLIYIFTSWRIWHKLLSIAAKHFKFKSCLCWTKI